METGNEREAVRAHSAQEIKGGLPVMDNAKAARFVSPPDEGRLSSVTGSHKTDVDEEIAGIGIGNQVIEEQHEFACRFANPREARTLLHLIDIMLEYSHGTYLISFFRQLARQGKLPEAILKTPMEKGTVFQLILDNEEAINNFLEHDILNKAQVYLDCHQLYSFKMIKEKYGQGRSARELLKCPDSIILDVGDSNQAKEMVHIIGINHVEKYVVR